MILKAIRGAIFTCLNNQPVTVNNPVLLFISACMMQDWIVPGQFHDIKIPVGKVCKPLFVYYHINHFLTVGTYPSEPDEKSFTGK